MTLTIGCGSLQYYAGYVSKAGPLERLHVGLTADVATGGSLGLTRHIRLYCSRLAIAVSQLLPQQPPRLSQLSPQF